MQNNKHKNGFFLYVKWILMVTTISFPRFVIAVKVKRRFAEWSWKLKAERAKTKRAKCCSIWEGEAKFASSWVSREREEGGCWGSPGGKRVAAPFNAIVIHALWIRDLFLEVVNESGVGTTRSTECSGDRITEQKRGMRREDPTRKQT